jgi:sec-independent protein translocase protein TatA
MVSTSHLGIVALLVIILFGTKRLPELGSGLGKAINNFKNSFREGNELDITSADAKGSAAAKEEGK